ncbi:MAG TPA: hypothetical protein VG737_16010 [Cyclobacteriaceae bacterium]|nr:hypothetical protein [Cyclobacteriaceae bacterium]
MKPFNIIAAIITLALSSYVNAQIPWEIDVIKSETIGTEPGFSYAFSPINSPNYFQLGSVTLEQSNGKRANFRKMLGYKTMKVSNLIVPMDNFPAQHMETLAMKTVFNGEVLHYDGKVSTVKFDRRVNYKNTGEFVCQYDHEKGEWSELVSLGAVDDLRFFYPMGADRDENYYYYAITHRVDYASRMGEPTSYELARLDLKSRKVEQLFTLDMPKRGHYLHLDHTMISPDGHWLILSEYGDKAWRRSNPGDAQPVAYIVDIRNKSHITTRIPDTPYGHVITPDSKYMILGSYETGEVAKIELETGKKVAQIKSTTTIFNFFLAPSGNYFLVDYDEEKCPRKVYDVRSALDLKLITSVMLADLYSSPEMSRGLKSIMDGRLLISRTVNPKDSLKLPTAVLIHRLPENIRPNEPGSPLARRLELAETIANGKLYAERNGIELNPPQYDMGKATSVTISSDNNVIVTGSHWLDEKTSEETIVKLTRAGDKIWETKLATVKDAISSAGMHMPAPDGGCVLYFMYYHIPKSLGIGRLARIDGSGKLIYDTQFTHLPNPNATYMTKGMELKADGSVKIIGEIYPNPDAAGIPWIGTVNPQGKLIKSEY